MPAGLVGGQLGHQVRDAGPGQAADQLGGNVCAGLTGWQVTASRLDQRDGRVEVRAADRAEDGDQHRQDGHRGGRVDQQLQQHVTGEPGWP